MGGSNLSFGEYTPTSRNVLLSDCNESERIRLQNEVNSNCKGQRSKCLREDACPILSEKMARINRCIQARTKINTKCYRGGDLNHNKEITKSINSLIKCQHYYASKCGNSEGVPTLEPVSIPAPNPNEDFMEMMERLTGLTGTALIIYIIISEGSRLFPPRNFVPIP